MKMVLMNWLISDKMMPALCWTLLHSLWQGLLLAIIAALVIMFTRRSTAAFRYNFLTILFLLFIVVTGFTFIRQVSISKTDQAEQIGISTASPRTAHNSIINNETTASTTSPLPYFQKMGQYFNEHASLIVAIWFILFIARLLRILSNIGYAQRIRHCKIAEPTPYWKKRITELAQILGMQASILLLESAIIKVPVVVGLLKPVILMPLGLLASLPPEQVEAILLHELAHIRRKDYLVNLLQSFAEVVFFFNPAILWLSSLMREERENCCDDLAISRIKNKKQFLQALVAFQEYAMHESDISAAIAFAGRKNHLLNRVKRIIYNENKKLNAMEKGFFILSIVAISLVGFVSINRLPEQKQKSPIITLPSAKALDAKPVVSYVEPVDTVPEQVELSNLSYLVDLDDAGETKTKTITATDKSGKRYKIVTKNDGPKEFYINDKKIPGEEMDNYKKIIARMEQAAVARQKKDLEKVKKDQWEQSEKVEKLEAERMLLMQKLRALDEERAKFNYESMKTPKDFEAAKIDLLNEKIKMRHERSKEMLQNKSNLHNEKLLRQKINADANHMRQLQQLNQKMERVKIDQMLQNEKDQIRHKQLLNEKMSFLQNKKGWEPQQRSYILIDPIIEDIVKENIVPSQQEDISFDLNENRFIVNGKKQTAEVHDRFKNKYLKKEGDFFKFSRKNGNTSTTVHLN